MTLGLNREGIRQKYTKNGLPIGVERQGQTMLLKFIYLNFPPVVAVNCDNRKAMGKEKWHKAKFEKSTKNDSIEFREKNMTKWKSNFKSTNS